ncbi:MAG: Crp/Fnr family transcriptional regulator [Pseudomonadota bacterium]
MKGSPGQGMMAVLSGRVKVSSPAPHGKEIMLNVINPGEVFGEIALLDGKERTADATAMSDCELLVLNRRDFVPFLERNPALCIRLLGVLCERLRHTDQQVADLMFLGPAARLAKALLQLAETPGEHSPGGTRIALKGTQRELGNRMGLSREGTNKQLRRWGNTGIVGLGRGFVTFKDGPALRRLVDQEDRQVALILTLLILPPRSAAPVPRPGGGPRRSSPGHSPVENLDQGLTPRPPRRQLTSLRPIQDPVPACPLSPRMRLVDCGSSQLVALGVLLLRGSRQTRAHPLSLLDTKSDPSPVNRARLLRPASRCYGRGIGARHT